MSKPTCIVLICLYLISGCVSSDIKQDKKRPPGTAEQYISKGEAMEQGNSLTKALEQYEIALTLEPENSVAMTHKQQVLLKLRQRARHQYEKGLALEEQGKYEAARTAYLSALQNWPGHEAARQKLSVKGISQESQDFIVHRLAPGETVSKLALIYYGDLHAYPVIGKFNNLKDVTMVRIGDQLKIPAFEGTTVSGLQQKQQAYLESKKAGKTEPQKEQDQEEQTQQDDQAQEIDHEQPVQLPENQASVPELEPEPEPEPEQEQEQEETVRPAEAIETPVPAPEPEPEPEPAKAAQSHAKALDLYNQKKYAQAIPLLESALAEDPENSQLPDLLFNAHFQMGLSHFNAGDYLLARSSFTSALSRNPSCGKCPDYIVKCEETYKEKHYNLGIHYFGKEKLQKAIEQWQMVSDIDPQYKDVTPNLKKAIMLHERLESIKKGSAQ